MFRYEEIVVGVYLESNNDYVMEEHDDEDNVYEDK